MGKKKKKKKKKKTWVLLFLKWSKKKNSRPAGRGGGGEMMKELKKKNFKKKKKLSMASVTPVTKSTDACWQYMKITSQVKKKKKKKIVPLPAASPLLLLPHFSPTQHENLNYLMGLISGRYDIYLVGVLSSVCVCVVRVCGPKGVLNITKNEMMGFFFFFDKY